MESLYDRMGDERAVTGAVAIFYRRMLEDPKMQGYFDDINIKQQRCKMAQYLSLILSDDPAANDYDLSRAHENISITDDEFDRALEHFQQSLQTLGIAGTMLEEATYIVASTRKDVVNS